MVRRLLYGRTETQQLQNPAYGVGLRSIHRATAGTLMAASAKTFGYARDIELAFAAQAHAKTSVGQFAEERRRFDFADGEHVIHQAFAVFFLRSAALHLFLCNPGPANVALNVEVSQRLAQQSHLGHGVGKVDAARAV